MPQDVRLIFADRVSHFYATQFGFPPMAGRLLGYLLVCEAPQRSIDQLSAALLASRSAVADAATLLERYRMVQRIRMAGERVDRVSLAPVGQQLQHFFDVAAHEEQAALYRKGLALVADSPSARGVPLQEAIALAEFLAERLPKIMDQWRGRRDEARAMSEWTVTNGKRPNVS